jgi:hypothetical protein
MVGFFRYTPEADDQFARLVTHWRPFRDAASCGAIRSSPVDICFGTRPRPRGVRARQGGFQRAAAATTVRDRQSAMPVVVDDFVNAHTMSEFANVSHPRTCARCRASS